ncbi:MAG: hypothetical protein J7L07_05085 [Candidatus Odinarchaeota archaeon]|nr:hypothetical protein [Candidatus Odinarchaeota archaeon]
MKRSFRWVEIWLAFKQIHDVLMIRVEAKAPTDVDMPDNYTRMGRVDKKGNLLYHSEWFNTIHEAEAEAINLAQTLIFNKHKTMFLRELRKCTE